MRWSLLGPVQVTAGGRVLPIDRPQHRAVLALLLLNADRLVPFGQVVAALWADGPPASARTQVQVCVSRIRAALRDAGGDGLLTTQGGGYRLTVRGTELDLADFTGAIERARVEEAAGRRAEAARLLRDGLALWRGPALAGAAGAFVEAAAAGLDEQRLLAYERLAAVELDLGRYAATARALRPLVAEHPLREPLVAGYLLALAGCGQQAAALRLYAETRRHLVDELGVEPGPELSGAHLRVLRGHPPGRARARATRRAAPGAAPRRAGLVHRPGGGAAATGRAAARRR